MSLRPMLLASLCLVAMFATVTDSIAADPSTPGWIDVRSAINRGLPKTAIEKLQPIITSARQAGRYDEAIRAIGLKIALESNVHGNRADERITRLQAEIAKAPEAMKPVFNAILANWYWNYFQQNRWQFMQRTQTAGPPGDDLTTWDLSQILAKIDKQFQITLSQSDKLQQIPIAKFDALFDKGTAPDAYRPTLYDVLVYNALDFYSAGEQAGGRQIDSFDVRTDSPVFSPVDDFLRWKPDTTDTDSPTFQAIRLYQDLLSFHANDDDRSALMDANLARLIFANNVAKGSDKTDRFHAALRRFAKENDDHPIAARALYQLALGIYFQKDRVKAREIAQTGLTKFPQSVGGKQCDQLIQQIDARHANVSAERVWNRPGQNIQIEYRNITAFHFRLVPFDFAKMLGENRNSPERLATAQREALLARKSVKTWSVTLPQTKDYQERIEWIETPDDIPPGGYYLIASHDPGFVKENNVVSFSQIWVTELALITRNETNTGIVDGFVLDAQSGEPIAGAAVRAWTTSRRSGQPIEIPATKTNANGIFQFKSSNNRTLIIHASHDGQQIATANLISSYINDRTRVSQQTQFFTDRSIYRPGQTIRYKGICMSVDHKRDSYHTLAGREVTVRFLDVNNKEVETQTHRTNDYGSFSGSVTAPRDRLMGRMRIQVQNGPPGQTQFRVEEYKRPKFRVEVKPPTEAAKLGGIVKVQGVASSYTGAAINDAKVTYRIVRGAEYPVWWWRRCWWMPPTGSSVQEIDHGTATTAADGTFDIQFDAKPDLSINAESEPIFRFTVYADVTDSTGETRSNQIVVSVGYTAMSATLSVDRWLSSQEPIELKVRTRTINGDPEKATGRLKIYALKEPERVIRPPLRRRYYGYRGYQNPPKPDPANPDSWELGDVVVEQEIQTDATGNLTVPVELQAGMYRARLVSQDRFGKQVTAETQLQVIDPAAKKFAIKIPHFFDAKEFDMEVGDRFTAIWGSGYEKARAYVEVVHRGKVLQSYWTDPNATQATIVQNVDESMRGGFQVRCTMVRQNRAYINTRVVNVPWSNKKLQIKWERFVSKLQPGAKERWTAIITGPDAKKAAAEMVATLYDASLDAYAKHHWPSGFNVFRQDNARVHSRFENQLRALQSHYRNWSRLPRPTALTYRSFPPEIIHEYYHRMFSRRGRVGGMGMEMSMDMDMGMGMSMGMPARAGAVPAFASRGLEASVPATAGVSLTMQTSGPRGDGNGEAPDIDLANVAARKNLNETAFFFPHLIAMDDGMVKMEFTMPEALTQWNFMGFAHDSDLRAGWITDQTVTAKDLMIQPNPPRFVREGDVIQFTAKVSNQSPTHQRGVVRLSLADARTGDAVDDQLGNVDLQQSFDVAAGESKSYAWKISVPDGMGFLTYKIVGSTGRLSDGEEGFLPVLSRRLMVTESLSLPIRGKQTKQFRFDKLLKSAESDSLQHQSLTLQMVSNPSWYAVMALPYLMEYPYECSEQTFNRFYANSLAKHIAGSDPKIHRVFETWRNTPALDSPLQKNQDLKSVMLQETPWVLQAEAESQARRNVGILFDDNRLNDETRRTIRKLTHMQLANGQWPWFPGGKGNDYITLYITTGFGRLRHLGVDVDPAAAIKSLAHLDQNVTQQYRSIKPEHRDRSHLTQRIALYLYGRSFFLKDQPIAAAHREAVDYWLAQSRKHWLGLGNRQSQAHLAIALKRFGDRSTAQGIMASIKERSVNDEEMGMFWPNDHNAWWWYHAPIESQAMMIEAFDEVMDDEQAVEDCKVWLIKQKQTQDWETTKATADAVYALLLRGANILSSDALVEVSLAGKTIQVDQVQAGTGFIEKRFASDQIAADQGNVRLTKVDDGVAWGSLHWQYLEDVSKITPHDDTPLKLTKELFVKKNTDKGPALVAVDGPVAVGDELVVRVVLRTDRDMEFVHLKDGRGSGTEPVNVLSGYRFQDGLSYYESTRDTASHFFIDYLPKGVYVFEYSTRVQLRGKYETGIANIQCMYAPQFNSHSESVSIIAD